MLRMTSDFFATLGKTCRTPTENLFSNMLRSARCCVGEMISAICPAATIRPYDSICPS